MHFIINAGILAVTLLVLATFLPGIKISSRGSAVVTALVFGVLNLLIGWLLKIVVTGIMILPAILTFGLALILVSFIVNTILLWVTDKLLPAFEIKDGKTLLVTSGVVTAVNAIVHHL